MASKNDQTRYMKRLLIVFLTAALSVVPLPKPTVQIYFRENAHS